eukprot:3939210-Rhodomonas_salina.1
MGREFSALHRGWGVEGEGRVVVFLAAAEGDVDVRRQLLACRCTEVNTLSFLFLMHNLVQIARQGVSF